MGISRNKYQVAYGLTNALQTLAPDPIVVNRDPLSSDEAMPLTLWLNKLSQATWVCAGTLNGSTVWSGIGGNPSTLASLIVTGNASIGGTLGVTGATTLSAALTVNSGAGAIAIGTDAVGKTVTVGNTTSGTTVTINTPTGHPVILTQGASVQGVYILAGSGAPTGVTAPKGSLYSNTAAASTTTRLYINTDGGTTWTTFTTAA